MSYTFRRPWRYMGSPAGVRATNFIGTAAAVVAPSLVYNPMRYQHMLIR